MTNAQLKDLLRSAIRYIARENRIYRDIYTSKGMMAGRHGLRVAKTDMLLAKMRRAVARPRTIKHK